MVRSKSVVRAGGANEAFTMSVIFFYLKCRSALSTRSVSSPSIYYCLIHNTEEEQNLIILCIISIFFFFFFLRKKAVMYDLFFFFFFLLLNLLCLRSRRTNASTISYILLLFSFLFSYTGGKKTKQS